MTKGAPRDNNNVPAANYFKSLNKDSSILCTHSLTNSVRVSSSASAIAASLKILKLGTSSVTFVVPVGRYRQIAHQPETSDCDILVLWVSGTVNKN